MRHNGSVDVVATMTAPFESSVVFEVIANLDNYPSWLSILPRVERLGDTAWNVELKGKIGPLARSKRLRMVRTSLAVPHQVVFERVELDGRDHSEWVLRADVETNDESTPGCTLTMNLHYGGSFGDQLLKRMLINEIESSKPRLLELLSELKSQNQ